MSSEPNHQPTTILRHPVPKVENDQGSLYVYGSKDSTHLVIMCSGYPDDQTAFMGLASQLAATCHCLVGITCVPGYDPTIPLESYPKWGYDFDDWPKTVREAVKCLRGYSSQSPEKTTLTGIFHDWGVVSGSMYTNQCLDEIDDNNTMTTKKKDPNDIYTPDRMVSIDILMPPSLSTPNRVKGLKTNTPYEEFSRVLYTGFLASTFVMSRYLPPLMTVPFYMAGNAVCKLFNAWPLSSDDFTYLKTSVPTKSITDLQRTWYMAHAYKSFWKMLLTGKIKEFVTTCSLPSDLKRTPVLHLYGTSKPYTLSDANGLLQLEQESSSNDGGGMSRVVKIDQAGHWIHIQQPDSCLKAIQTFFDDCGIKSK